LVATEDERSQCGDLETEGQPGNPKKETRDRRTHIAEPVGALAGGGRKQGHRITRIAVAFEAEHDSLWLARWVAAQGV
jgi:hypothetical protein